MTRGQESIGCDMKLEGRQESSRINFDEYKITIVNLIPVSCHIKLLSIYRDSIVSIEFDWNLHDCVVLVQ